MKYIDLRNKNLSVIPNDIDLDVEYLDLSFNSLSTLPDNFDSYHKLKILFLSNNNFIKIPQVVSKLKSLFMLSFRNNKIVEVDNIPNKVGWLILTNNLIKQIVKLGHLTDLRKLMLSGNLLETLPSDLINCQKLELIRLSNNNFEKVPSLIFELDNLAWISMANNPCFPLPKLTGNKQLVNMKDIPYNEKIGEGTSGIVHKSILYDKEVAVKIYKGKMTSDGLSTNEMYILSAIKPNINLIEIIGLLYQETKTNIQGIIMPLFNDYNPIGSPPSFDTITRDTYDKNKYKTQEELDNIIKQIEHAIHHLHQNNTIHGDFYAHNIIHNTKTNHIVLTDFGASFIISDKKLLKKFIKIEIRSLNILKNELLNFLYKPNMDLAL